MSSESLLKLETEIFLKLLIIEEAKISGKSSISRDLRFVIEYALYYIIINPSFLLCYVIFIKLASYYIYCIIIYYFNIVE